MAVDWAAWQPQERAVLMLLRKDDQLLLILKKRGLGTGKVTAPGGRVEVGESWTEAAVRETEEETGMTPQGLQFASELRFQFVDGYSLHVQAFLCDHSTGTLRACDEADPFWQPTGQIPWQRMWADDALWLPPALAGQFVDARFVFEGEQMREAEITVLDRPPGSSNG